MRIFIAGEPAEELAGQVRQLADKMLHGPRRPLEVSEDIGALALQKAGSDADYQEQFMRLLRYRDAVDTLDFEIPRRAGPAGLIMRPIKRLLWKLLRYQHDRITFRQNLINGLFTQGIELEMRQRRRETAEMRARIDSLERRIRAANDRSDP